MPPFACPSLTYRFGTRRDKPPDDIILLRQTHSNKALTITRPPPPAAEGDALITSAPGLALGIASADCAPVLFADSKRGIIAAAHAGWRGTLNGILENTLAAMEQAGAQKNAVIAAIGPCISQHHYETGAEFYDAHIALTPWSARFFLPAENGRYWFDLSGYAAARLRRAGIASVWQDGRCTYAGAQSFFSHRRQLSAQGDIRGRQISFILRS